MNKYIKEIQEYMENRKDLVEFHKEMNWTNDIIYDKGVTDGLLIALKILENHNSFKVL